ncbi:EamA family transporter [Microcella alkalica]|nr:EamA family transporter [Microcella alkalica]
MTRVPPWSFAVLAMFSVQLGSALSVGLIDEVGAGGTAWLRLSMGAIVFLLIARPRLAAIRRADVVPLLALGVATGLMTVFFLAALERIPLGTAVAIEFLGPLTVAAVRSGGRRALVWPIVALAGVVLLTEPWLGEIDPLGVLFAALAGIGWGAYIYFTQTIGDRFDGIQGLALTIPVAALTAAVVGVPQAWGQIDITVLLTALGLALLLPVLPFALEMLALRRMTHTAFGTLMAVEPAIGLVLGLLILAQSPSAVQVVGIVIVVLAGAAAQRGGRREAADARTPARLPAAPGRRGRRAPCAAR